MSGRESELEGAGDAWLAFVVVALATGLLAFLAAQFLLALTAGAASLIAVPAAVAAGLILSRFAIVRTFVRGLFDLLFFVP